MEALVASAILALAVAAIAQAVTAGQTQTHAAMRDLRAVSLAEALLEEVLAKSYADPDGPGQDAETARGDFDDLDDFNGFTEPAGAVSDAAGTLYPPAFQAFRRSVAVVPQTVNVAGFAPAPCLRVTVAVDDGSRVWTLTRHVPEPLP